MRINTNIIAPDDRGISWVLVIILILSDTESEAKVFYQNLKKQLLDVII